MLRIKMNNTLCTYYMPSIWHWTARSKGWWMFYRSRRSKTPHVTPEIRCKMLRLGLVELG